MFDNLRADLSRARDLSQEAVRDGRHTRRSSVGVLFQLGPLAVVTYRISHWAVTLRVPVVRQVLLIFVALFRRWMGLWTGVSIDPRAEIGPGLIVHTPYAIHIGRTKIGANCTVQTGVLIAAGTRRIGNNVYFGAGAKLIGDCVIGDNVVIMPNSLVLTDVRDNTTIVGVPARIKLPGGRPQRFLPQQRTTPTSG